MKAILLCPGPSLARYQPRPADLVVGVNRAAIAFPVNAWAALDPPLVRKIEAEVIGSPLLVTSADTPGILSRQGYAWRGKTVLHKDLYEYVPHAVNYVLYSATTALVYAAREGATSIDVFGADWEGYLDYDGVAGGTNRTQARWTSEVMIWGATVEALFLRGVAVNRRAPHELR